MQQMDGLPRESRWTYLKVARQLRQEILSGRYNPAKRLPGEPALAERFGVGRTTVSKALAILQRAGLIFRVPGSGTYVQPGAARGKPRLVIGYVASEATPPENSPSATTLEGAWEWLAEQGHFLEIIPAAALREAGNPVAQIQGRFAAGEITGLIIAEPFDQDLLWRIAEVLPLVVCLHDHAPDHIFSVPVDFAWGYFVATRHLLELGHSRLGLLHGSILGTFGYRAVQAFRLAVQHAGLDVDRCPMVHCGYQMQRARRVAASFLAEHPSVTGLVCGSDTAAQAVLEAARERGLSVPDELSIVGCNDVPLAAQLEPPLTTLRIDFAAAGRKAAQMLLGQIYGHGPVRQTYIQPELIVRGSTAPPPSRQVR